MAIANSASAVDCDAADSDVQWQCTVVSQSRKPDAVNYTSAVDFQSTDSASAAAACRRHTETNAVRHEACRLLHWIVHLLIALKTEWRLILATLCG